MKIIINYLDNNIIIDPENVFSLEIENKHYFYRIVNDFNDLSNNKINDSIKFYDNKSFEELNYFSKLNIYSDFFNFDINNKKIINTLYSTIEKDTKINEIDIIAKSYKKIEKIIKNKLKEFNFDIEIQNEFELKEVLKLFKVNIIKNNLLIDNLLILVDTIKFCASDTILIFINLKSYLTNNELEEFYKYCIYNEIRVLLLDSKAYGINLKYEKKIIIDEDLFEIVI